MILTEKVTIRGNSKNIKHYTEKGYDIKINEFIEVYTNDLPTMSSTLVEVECDTCGNRKEIMYKSYSRNIQKYGSYTCSSKCNKNKDNQKPTETKKTLKKTVINKTINKKPETPIKKPIVLEPFDYENIDNNKTLLEKYKNLDIVNIKGDNITLKCDLSGDHEFTISKFGLKNRLLKNTFLCTECNHMVDDSAILENNMFNFIRENYDGKIIENSDKIIDNFELDIYLPELNLAFEFSSVYWHNELYKKKQYHKDKSNLCEEKGIQLIFIWEDDWINKEDVAKSMILNKLRKSKHKLYARKCKIKEVTDNKEAREILENGHIQGFIGSKIKLGLYYNDELVSIMTLGKKRVSQNSKSKGDGDYELLRFCNRRDTNVVGAASKLFKHFLKNYDYTEVITYADRSYSNGNLYQTLGFEYVHKTEPNYYYVVDGIRKHRFGFRKDVLVADGYDANLSEHQIMLDRNIYRVFNAGNIKFIYKNDNN